jgi:hypothetical protein
LTFRKRKSRRAPELPSCLLLGQGGKKTVSPKIKAEIEEAVEEE